MSNSILKAEYFAFISHKGADEKVAARLKRFIESYKLPAEIRKNNDVPKSFSPVCTYEVDFSPNPLSEEMTEKLRRSKYLIVLCSENLVNKGTKYVNFEIETFVALKSAEGIDPLKHIIPIIINGEVGSPEHECFPEALKAMGDDCPIAVKIDNCKSEREAFIYAMSGMLDIDATILLNRDKTRRIRNRFIASGIAVAALVTSVFLGEYFIPRQYHYLDFVTENALPVGIERLSPGEYKKTGAHYVITKQMHRVVSLEYVNSKGSLIDHNSTNTSAERPAKYEYSYSGSALSSVTYYDKSQNPYFVMQYSASSAKACDLKDPHIPEIPYYVATDYEKNSENLLADYNATAAGDISRFEYEYDKNGHIKKVTFHADSTGRLAGDNCVFGFEYKLDEKGRIIEKYFLDAKGKRRLNSEGIFCKTYTYDESNDLVEQKNLDDKGKLVADSNGIVWLKKTYDKNHNTIRMDFLDAEGKPMIVEDYGGASQVREFDENGMISTIFLYDEKGEPTELVGHFGCSYTYDKNGHLESTTLLDLSKKPVLLEGVDYATQKYVNDKNGNTTETLYCDESGELINTAYGYARKVNEYNEFGMLTVEKYYDKDGKLTAPQGLGYCIKKTEYDKCNREISISYFGKEEEPVNIKGPSHSYGYHKLLTEYEYGANTKITICYYDKDNKKTNLLSESLGESYAQCVVYVQNGDITYSAMYDKDGNQYDDILELEIEYSAKAERIETMINKNPEGVITRTDRTTYSVNGVPSELYITEYDNEKITRTSSVSYTENGAREKSESIDYGENGEKLLLYNIGYDDLENMVTEDLWDYTNPDLYHISVERTFEGKKCTRETELITDAHGNVISECLTEHADDGTTVTETAYLNGKKNSEVVKGYNDEGKCSSVVRNEYNENELLISSTASMYNDEGKISSMVSIEDLGEFELLNVYEFNEDGSFNVTSTLRDKNGEIISEMFSSYDSEGNKISD